jgi:ATP-dependent 26S proteasome regulatory subunit
MESMVLSHTTVEQRREFIKRLLHTLGLTFLSFLFIYFMGKIFSKSLSSDSMKFLRKKKITAGRNREFNIGDHWVGDMPESAQEILDIFHHPDVFQHFNTAVPRGILLHGKPGTGKTHFARIIADLTQSEFFYASAAQFDEVFVGKGAQRIRNLFDEAQQATEHSWFDRLKAIWNPSEPLLSKRVVIFIDELDAIGSRNGLGVVHSSNHATVSQLLTCLDGLEQRDNIFVIAATNNLSQIDPAIRRSGRFDRVIEMRLPNEASRLALLNFYLKERPGKEQLEAAGILKQYATLTEGFSSADIKTLANEVTMNAVRKTLQSKKRRKTVILNNPESCVITAENFKAAFTDVKTKITQERKTISISKIKDALD